MFKTFSTALIGHYASMRNEPSGFVNGNERFYCLRDFILYFHLNKYCEKLDCGNPIKYRDLKVLKKNSSDVQVSANFMKGMGIIEQDLNFAEYIQKLIALTDQIAEKYAQYFLNLSKSTIKLSNYNKDDFNSKLTCFIESQNFKSLFNRLEYTSNSGKYVQVLDRNVSKYADKIEKSLLFLAVEGVAQYIQLSNNKDPFETLKTLQEDIHDLVKKERRELWSRTPRIDLNLNVNGSEGIQKEEEELKS